MKAVLVIEMPEDCWECPLTDVFANCDAIKIVADKYGMDIKKFKHERAKWCPLRPMPKRYAGNLKDYEVGWNDALEELEK